MDVPLELSFRNVPKTAAAERLIREKAARLDKFHSRLISCRVMVEQNQTHQRSGSAWRVRIETKVPPGHELVVLRESGEGDMHTNIETRIREAFDAMERQIKDIKGKQQGAVKNHTPPENLAIVSSLDSRKGYGFLKALDDGRSLFFHRNSVLHDQFDRLHEGVGVRFTEEMGEKGPQATSVQITDVPERL